MGLQQGQQFPSTSPYQQQFGPQQDQQDQQDQQAFAFGHQVIGIWDTLSPNVLRSVRIQRI
ncbi:hypothetical protein QQY66_08895 [Streptomyces sp. DG2A-72]|uniref:hypothetical protein n=1 Tax=Streptomyces sp. DG2A-72 TaxID=3051386 RepID=UPI00265C6689|nr:hypothetical protein [Streptomyces sp. DG2A-72]MDO0931791.1 hypothetical protein [Streptomyces sp. DG2A-72]